MNKARFRHYGGFDLDDAVRVLVERVACPLTHRSERDAAAVVFEQSVEVDVQGQVLQVQPCSRKSSGDDRSGVHRDKLTDTPSFWTREQRGEEASTWLLFAQKYAYLQQSAGSETTPTRAFCVPSSAVAASAPPERILLLLAVALMKSFGITVDICAEPEYAALPGFVFDGHRHAIVANWGGADGIWQVDLPDTIPLLREFADATGFAHAHSVIAAETAAARLRALADYLDLDWPWLVRRCHELGEYGTAGIAEPRSRLLSTDGVDQACRFLASVDRANQLA